MQIKTNGMYKKLDKIATQMCIYYDDYKGNYFCRGNIHLDNLSNLRNNLVQVVDVTMADLWYETEPKPFYSNF